ncbi:hypothetical protein [uncultured Sphingomonas sp.]|uniref:hypothetical protein n=1 Tax=uncultured Sphingomonas sp. TaxID=158754 RepID=UPI0025F41105|nr:hypothetical protein [uncultured Sphingomonas sp.]
MTKIFVTPAERARAYRALMDGIRVMEERIAPLWSTPENALSNRRRTVRARVTANGFRELDVLLAHWVGIVAMRPVRMAEIDHWREADAADDRGGGGFTIADILRIATEYRHAAPCLSDGLLDCPSGIAGCDLAA